MCTHCLIELSIKELLHVTQVTIRGYVPLVELFKFLLFYYQTVLFLFRVESFKNFLNMTYFSIRGILAQQILILAIFFPLKHCPIIFCIE